MATATPSRLRAGLEEVGDLAAFSAQTIKSLPASTRYAAETFRQLGILVRGSTGLIAAMVVFVGFSATNYGYYFLKSAGAADYIGLVPGVVGPRLVAALLFGYTFAAKVGCGIVGEVGAMKINEELDAYEVEGVTTQKFVIGTRVTAALLYVPIITPIALVAATVGAYVNGVLVIRAVPSETFFRFNWANQALTDQLFCFGLIGVLAVVIVLVSCFYGTTVKPGPGGVGAAVARSLVVNLTAIHVIIGLAVFVVYGVSVGLPIGG